MTATARAAASASRCARKRLIGRGRLAATPPPALSAAVIVPFLQLALSMALVGANVVVGKLLAQALPVPLVLFLRCLAACAVLAPPALRGGAFRLDRASLLNLTGQAASGTVAYNVLLLAGLRRTGALEAGLVLATIPAVVALASAALLRERLRARHAAAALLAAVGMAALAVARGGPTAGRPTAGSGAGASGAGGSLDGDALVFLSVLAEAAYVLLARANAGRLPVLRAAFVMQVASATLLAPWGGPMLPAHLATLADPALLGLLLFHALTASVLSVVLWYSGVRRVPASRAGVFAVLLPATAALLAVLVLGERPTPALGAGLALTVSSLLLATWPDRRPRHGT